MVRLDYYRLFQRWLLLLGFVSWNRRRSSFLSRCLHLLLVLIVDRLLLFLRGLSWPARRLRHTSIGRSFLLELDASASQRPSGAVTDLWLSLRLLVAAKLAQIRVRHRISQMFEQVGERKREARGASVPTPTSGTTTGMPRPKVDWSLYYVTARDDTNGLDDLDSFLRHIDDACKGPSVCLMLPLYASDGGRPVSLDYLLDHSHSYRL